MAKQTFTTGQVLTAAQMTSLQETAMGGGPATAKTASYVLVAADAGTTVAMNAAGATTITVNTGLFAAGDTVFIQNLGAGACTVTAGTATVATAGSLILPQNDAGILYFTSASAAIFYDYIQVGATSPLTTKGDLYTYGTSDTRLGVGANGTTLVADSSTATGLKWATPASGKVLQVIYGTTSTALEIASTSLTDSGITATITPSSATSKVLVLVNAIIFTQRLNASGPQMEAALKRGGTTILDYQGLDKQMVTLATQNQTINRITVPINMGILDEPATTSATTYKVQGSMATTADTAKVTFQPEGTPSTIILMEIGA